MNSFKDDIKSHALKEELIIKIVQSFILSHMENANYKSPLLNYFNPSSAVYKQSKESLIRLFSDVLGEAKTICDMYVNGYRSVRVIRIDKGYNLKLEMLADRQETYRLVKVTSTIRVVDEYKKFIRELANEGYVFNDEFLFKCLNYELINTRKNEQVLINNPLNTVINDVKIVKSIIDLFYKCFEGVISLYLTRSSASEKWVVTDIVRSRKPSSSCLQFMCDTKKEPLGSTLVVYETIKLKTVNSTNA